MGHDELSERENWQTESGSRAIDFEKAFYNFFNNELQKAENKNLKIRKKPTEFENIYSDVVLSKEVENSIFQPGRKYKHGIHIDFAIDNIATNKTIYIEIKRQDGWVENLPSSAGRGNAHERLCKFFTPGLLELLRKQGNLSNVGLPFWIVFGGNMTRDPKRVREITYWFGEYKDHFFMWRNVQDNEALLQHFNTKIKPLLF